jgi:hypothetical protein
VSLCVSSCAASIDPLDFIFKSSKCKFDDIYNKKNYRFYKSAFKEEDRHKVLRMSKPIFLLEEQIFGFLAGAIVVASIGLNVNSAQ